MGSIERYLLFELVTGETTVERRTLDGEKRLLVANTYPYRPTIATTDIALLNMTLVKGETLIVITFDKEFALYLKTATH